MKNLLLVPVLVLLGMGVAGAQNLVPQPRSIERNGENVALLPYPVVEADDYELHLLRRYLSDYLPAGRVSLSIDETMQMPAEGYRLEVARRGISIRGKDYNGVWNGIQTLLQLFPPDIYAQKHSPGIFPVQELPALVVEDWPSMSYRGVMLDVARTFVPAEEVMRLIDNISRHKINKFHWHLADDEGWRVEIKSVPELTGTGGFRGGDSPLFSVYGAWDRKYGGYYTQDEIREVVAYAAVRGVEVIPEIDLPGHSRAAAISRPEIVCGYTPDLEVSAGYDTRNVWCVAREENYTLLDTIIGELAELFPSEYIHLGGDEVEPGQWSHCPDCRALMAERGIADAARLEDVFMERAIAIAARHGKKAVVWNEAAASGKIPKTTMVWGWENLAAARRVAAAGYPTVVCAGSYFYFDQRQSPVDVGHIWAGVVSLEKVYSFDSDALGFTKSERQNVTGVEATLFGELYLENGPGYLDYQMFPRVCALSEVAWSPAAARSWSDFRRRLDESHLARLEAMDIGYRDSAPAQGPDMKTLSVTPTTSISSRRAPREGDWYMWTFTKPLACRGIRIRTGYGHLQRAGFPKGYVEISYDGESFEQIALLHDLGATIAPSGPVRALRVVNESHGNGESFTLVQPLKVY